LGSGGGQVMLACSAEFANAGTLRSLEKTYGFHLRSDQLIVLAGGETSATIGAAAARTNGTNTAMVYGTDGGIDAANLQVLDDDRNDQPIYAPVPIIREAACWRQPADRPAGEAADGELHRARLQQLNARVQIDGESAQSVAEGLSEVARLAEVTTDSMARRIDPLGALVAAVGAAALLWLPFVVFKPNRILPGDARSWRRCCRIRGLACLAACCWLRWRRWRGQRRHCGWRRRCWA
jgi:hypothetical protein